MIEQQTLKDLDQHIEKAFESLNRELTKVRTGRANVSMLEHIRVDYYGTPTPLTQVSAVNVADARLLVVKPWEKRLLPVIEKAIRDAGLGMNPVTDSEVIRLAVPALTQERRKELSKNVKKLGEEAKIAIRNSRRDAREVLEKAKKDGTLPEDAMEQGFKKIQTVVDKSILKVDEIVGKKEAEILEG